MTTLVLSIRQWLAEQGIVFNLPSGTVLQFPVDETMPVREGKDYGLTTRTISLLAGAWLEWRGLADRVLRMPELQPFLLELFQPGSSDDGWRDRERSEIEEVFAAPRGTDWFFGPQITRIDLALSDSGKLLILDPNVAPYGVTPMVAVSEKFGLKYPDQYIRRLAEFGGTWVADRSHGSASSLQWLCQRSGLQFEYSDQNTMPDRVIRQSRRRIHGREQTVNAPGVRTFESQLWPALSQVSGFTQASGLRFRKAELRDNCATSYLLKVVGDKIKVALEVGPGMQVHWIDFRTFLSIGWKEESDMVFLKCLSTSGCHQVTYSKLRENQIISAVRKKLFAGDGYLLLQPAQPCLIDGNRVRISIYLGYDGAFFGAEVTRVPEKYLLSHGGSHAAVSYLQI